jgi:hypothetical protein
MRCSARDAIKEMRKRNNAKKKKKQTISNPHLPSQPCDRAQATTSQHRSLHSPSSRRLSSLHRIAHTSRPSLRDTTTASARAPTRPAYSGPRFPCFPAHALTTMAVVIARFLHLLFIQFILARLQFTVGSRLFEFADFGAHGVGVRVGRLVGRCVGVGGGLWRG